MVIVASTCFKTMSIAGVALKMESSNVATSYEVALTLYSQSPRVLYVHPLIFKQWVDGWINKYMDGWMNERTNEWMNEWMSEWVSEWMSEWMSEWINEWMNEWMSEWVNKWMNERNYEL